MRSDLRDGSFYLNWEHCQAYYNANGEFVEANYLRKYRRAVTPVPAHHTRVIVWLKRQGEQEIKLLNAGILKRN